MKAQQKHTIEVISLGLAHAVQSPGLMRYAHRHNEVECNFIEAGTMTYLFGSTPIVVQAGQLALFWATIPHQVIHVETHTLFHWLTIPFDIFLQWQLAEQLTQQIIRGQFVLFPAPTTFHDVQQRFQQWHLDLQYTDAEHAKIAKLEIEAYLRRLTLQMQETSAYNEITQQQRSSPDTLSTVEQMACYIADHYTEIQHIDEVANSVHLHPSYAMSLFRKHFGVSIGTSINQYRLAHAQRLLITTNATTSSIALEAGFGSVSRFYTAFKTSCGQSPGEYRARLLPRIAEKDTQRHTIQLTPQTNIQ